MPFVRGRRGFEFRDFQTCQLTHAGIRVGGNRVCRGQLPLALREPGQATCNRIDARKFDREIPLDPAVLDPVVVSTRPLGP